MAHGSVRVILEAVTGLPLHREEGRALSDFLSGLGGSQAPPLKWKCFAVEVVSLRGRPEAEAGARTASETLWWI